MMTLDFDNFLQSIVRCYSKALSDSLPKLKDFENGKLINSQNNLHRSVALRIDAITELRTARDLNLELDYKKVWTKISESIKIIPVEATVSSIGSQGFLSIPLFKYDSDMTAFEFIRLHIWDPSISRYVNPETRDNFSIHNHLFHADSWILCGQVINDRLIVRTAESNTGRSLFSIEYNGTLNEVNQHTSTAQRTNTFVHVKQVSHENYMQGGHYCIKAGEFHKSGSNDLSGVSATLFSFTADNKFHGPSSVIGPSSIQSSEINRKEFIDPKELVVKIDEKINQ